MKTGKIWVRGRLSLQPVVVGHGPKGMMDRYITQSRAVS